MTKNSITVIILTKNEEANIQAAVNTAKKISNRIVVVDSGSNDMTVPLAKKEGAEVYYHVWPGYAKQFNWALDNCEIKTTWVFRLDADERIPDDLANEINEKLVKTTADGFEMRWRIFFMGKWIKHGGTHKPFFLRLFKYGKGRCEEKLMDEHIIVNGKVEQLECDLIHYDYKKLDNWLEKHIRYSNLEVMMYETQKDMTGGNENQKRKRRLYYKLPIFIRARLYYWYRYYIQMGFLDGKEGKIFAFLQAYWYRFIVDAKIYERDN